jgi:succinate dehydrogenase / fumarate reductase, cytochrome b subunit
MSVQISAIPRAFIWRKIHSLMGFAIVIYLVEHLLTNSLAALWIGYDGIGFIKMVNFIHSLPFLKVLEISLIGIPIAVHSLWGIKYALTSKSNARSNKGKKPALREYERNRAYSLQRLSSWVLLVGIILHVVQMRFMDYPKQVNMGAKHFYLTSIQMDEGLYTLAPRLKVGLYDQEKIDSLVEQTNIGKTPEVKLDLASRDSVVFDESYFLQKEKIQNQFLQKKFIETLSSFSLTKTEVVAICPDAGTAFLLNVRNTFKSFWMIGLYSIFVLAAAFHGFNGLWTFLISWGMILSNQSQKTMVHFCYGLMFVVAFLGLAAAWGTYWINLRY